MSTNILNVSRFAYIKSIYIHIFMKTGTYQKGWLQLTGIFIALAHCCQELLSNIS